MLNLFCMLDASTSLHCKLGPALKVAGRQRLAALAGILCRTTKGKANSKVVVFLSSKDSVEFHQQLFQGAFKFVAGRPLVDCPIYKLHGSLMQVVTFWLCFC